MDADGGAWTTVAKKERKSRRQTDTNDLPNTRANKQGISKSAAENNRFRGHDQHSRRIQSFLFSKEKLHELIRISVPEVIVTISGQIKSFQTVIERSGICKKDMSLVLQVLLKVSKGLSCEGDDKAKAIMILNEVFNHHQCYNFHSQLKQFLSRMCLGESFRESDLNVVGDLFYNLLEKIRGKYWTILPLETLFETVRVLSQNKMLKAKAKINSTCEYLRAFYDEMKEKQMTKSVKTSQHGKEDLKWDNSEYRDIQVSPQWHEISDPNPPHKLRANIVQGEYDDWMHYYDVQFRLLREDFIAPLRKGIADYRAGKEGRQIRNLRVYRGVRIGGNQFTRSGLCHTISFDVSKFWHVNWEHSKRLIIGSLLCLSSDNFRHKAIFAIITDRNTKDLQNGKLKVMFQKGSKVVFHQKNQTEFMMVESIAFYEASSHVLRSLQVAEDTSMPFTKYLIKNSSTVECPKYLKMSSRDVLYNLSFIIKKAVLRYPMYAKMYSEVKVLNQLAWPSQEDTLLDESQLKAMKMALTQEVVVIQGPPGTGKTYIGLKIVQALLDNPDFWSPKETRRENTRNGPPQLVEVRTGGPILIMFYTNHALDQFLEGILDLYKDKSDEKPNLIRVGGRCRSDTLQPYNLTVAMKNQKIPFHYRNAYWELEKKMEDVGERCKLELAKYSDPIHEFVWFSDIQSFISEHHLRSLKDKYNTPEEREAALELWLGLYDVEEYTLLTPVEIDDVQSEEEYQPSSDSSDDESEYESARSSYGDREDQYSGDHDVIKDELRARMLDGMKDMYTDIFGDRSIKPVKTNKKPTLTQSIKRIVKVVHCRNYKKFFRDKTHDLTSSQYNDLEAEKIEDVHQLDLDSRWELYKYWHSKFRERKLEELEQKCQQYNEVCEDANRARQNKERFALENAQIIGMTTTGTAKYQHILHMVKPKIVIVEEAAEVMESHIVSALNAGTQHLILIGDHKQLRPKPNDYDMVKKYKLDISLFERLVTNNFLHVTLENQHRMRPEIAELVHPHIYPTLHNHESVLKYPKVDGIRKNLYFISHNELEKASSDLSHANEYEAEYLIALCKFILQKSNYQPSQITILVTYTGQLLLMKTRIQKAAIKGVRICTVDNFQGEENDIILLSLVRSNKENIIGFLKEENRVCVSLSRARHGFYCIGNFNMLKTTESIWKELVPFMESKGNLGQGLEIHCVNHPKENYRIHLPEEFEQKSPKGGCTLPCGKRLNCGHTCPHKCHLTDPNHKEVRCFKPCMKQCPMGHDCKHPCCGPCICKEKVEKELRTCKHKHRVECSKDMSHFKCNKEVEKEIPGCGHVLKIACHKDPQIVKCSERVVKRFPSCSHEQEMACHEDPRMVQCLEKVVKVLPICGHEQTVRCREQLYRVKCTKLVQKTLPGCNHTQFVMCQTDICLVRCNSTCEKMCKRNLHPL